MVSGPREAERSFLVLGWGLPATPGQAGGIFASCRCREWSGAAARGRRFRHDSYLAVVAVTCFFPPEACSWKGEVQGRLGCPCL